MKRLLLRFLLWWHGSWEDRWYRCAICGVLTLNSKGLRSGRWILACGHLVSDSETRRFAARAALNESENNPLPPGCRALREKGGAS